ACIEGWNIYQAQFKEIICSHVFMDYDFKKQEFTDRRPQSGDFKPGEFEILLKETTDTVDLIFQAGLDWKALLLTIRQVRDENTDSEIKIHGIEHKGDGAFVVKVEVPQSADKEKLHQELTTTYENRLALMEAEATFTRQQLEDSRQKYADMKEITNILAQKQSTHIGELKMLNVGRDMNATGSTLNWGNIIGDVTNTVNNANTSDDIKDLLKSLAEQLQPIGEQLPQKEAEQLADDLQALTKEATKETPRKKWWELSVEGIKDAVTAVGVTAKPVLDILKQLTEALPM
ncbi:MAG: hypothetical protein GY869_22745, partial [Planctomycetes bacterium]|nr:hypothetical protein [Planctomycetota bacterium]